MNGRIADKTSFEKKEDEGPKEEKTLKLRILKKSI